MQCMEKQNTATSDLLPAVHQAGDGWMEAGNGEMQKMSAGSSGKGITKIKSHAWVKI